MNLQIAFDCLELSKALEVADIVKDYCDFMEVGTPLIKSEGMKAVTAFKRKFPDKIIVADTKIADAGKTESNLAFDAGADVVTVMSCAGEQTKLKVFETAKEKNKKIMIDLLGASDTIMAGTCEENETADYLCFHKSTDTYGVATSIDEYARLKKAVKKPIVVAGRITLESIELILKLKPHTVIIGGAVTRSDNPKESARYFYELIKSVVQ